MGPVLMLVLFHLFYILLMHTRESDLQRTEDTVSLNAKVIQLESTVTNLQALVKSQESKYAAVLSSVLAKQSSMTSELTNLKDSVLDLTQDQKEVNITLTNFRFNITQTSLEVGQLKNNVTELSALGDEVHYLKSVFNSTFNMIRINKVHELREKFMTFRQEVMSSLNETLGQWNDTQTEVAMVKEEQSAMKSSLDSCVQTSRDLVNFKSNVAMLQEDLLTVERMLNASSHGFSPDKTSHFNSTGSATFIRWGRTVCPAGNQAVYKGYAGGNHHKEKGSGSNLLCLPEDPQYQNHTPQAYARIYGSAYVPASGNVFSTQGFFNKAMPCVMCASYRKRASIMVPARWQCHPDWTLEYWGYLMANGVGHNPGEYVCLDESPEFVSGSKNTGQKLMYLVNSVCGTLPCPPYKNNWELTCAVCSH